MTDKIAIFLAIVLVALFAADYFYFEWDLPLIVGKKLAQLIRYIAFWR